LALTGGIALTDGLMEQLLGHGAAAKLSARFGEGVLNGFLIARIGLAAMMACRPVAFHALSQPKISEIAKSILAKNL
jgi:putative membrane protein